MDAILSPHPNGPCAHDGEWQALLPATAYGNHLRLVLRAACEARPLWWSHHELELERTLSSAPWALLVARIVSRRSQRMPYREIELPPERIAEAAISGWLSVEGEQCALSAAATGFVCAAMVVAFGEVEADLSFFPRLALGRLRIPPGAPLRSQLRRLLAGGAVEQDSSWQPQALRSRAALEAFLRARSARQEAGEQGFTTALAEVELLAGQAWDLLGSQLSASAQWTLMLWECREQLPAEDPRRAVALRALRRAPLSPSLSRRVWDEVQRRAHARAGRFIAGHLAQWSLWNPGQRSRCRSRARLPGSARPANGRWRVEHLQAWLERDHRGAVVALGDGVEEHALRRLAESGWQGLHGEGDFWHALATMLFWSDIMSPCAHAWAAPLQAWPLDWRRYGFTARRQAAIARTAVALVRDPLHALTMAYAALGEKPYPGWFTPPPRAAAEAVCRLMPRSALIRLLQRLLSDSHAFSGLPDLITWRGDELVLWEVKSPNDQLSDQQRAWLGWLDQEGIVAGELRVDARAPTQSTFLPMLPVAARTPQVATAAVRPRARIQIREPPATLSAISGADWVASVAEGSALPGGYPSFGSQPTLEIGSWTGVLGAGAVTGWDRPVIAIAALPVLAVLMVRRQKRRISCQRWYPVPAGWVMPMLVSAQARTEGGVSLCGSILLRRSGYVIPADVALTEPVVVLPDDLQRVQAGGCAAWQQLPLLEPLRVEALAEAWGCLDELRSQVALLGSRPFQLSLGDQAGTLRLSVQDEATIMWTVSSPRIQRGALPTPIA